jgi:transcriptional regulator with XRE-family HTH domain
MIGKRINAYLEENGIKQSFLVEKTGLKPCVISNICLGKRKIECVEYHKICKALGLPLETFLEEGE